jgi:outer membrane autotransporter protein
VTQAVTSISLVAPATSLYGYPVTLKATVSGVAPTGSVVFKDGATTIATVPLSSGAATFITSALSTGPHSLVASYGGDASNLPATSSVVSLTINPRPDPSKDPDVIGIINAQASAMERFGQTQMDSIQDHLTQLHDDDSDDGGPLSFGMSINTPNTESVAAQQWFGEDGDKALAYADASGASQGANPLTATGSGIQERALFHVWTAGSVNFGSITPSGGTDNSFTTPGVTVGIDARLMEHLKAGIALGYASDKTTIGDDGTRSDGKSVSIALYGSYALLPSTFLDVIGGYGHETFDSLRDSTDGDVFLNGSRSGSEWFGSATLSNEIKSGDWQFDPYGRVDAVHWTLDPYTETGSSTWALSYQGMSTTAVRAALGLRVDYSVPVDWGRLTIDADLEDAYRLSGDYDQGLTYADLPSGPFYSVTGAANATNQVTGGLGITAKLGTVNLRARYLLSLGSDWHAQTQSFTGGVGLAFN